MKYLEAKRLDTERQENKALGGPSSNKSGEGSGTAGQADNFASPQARQLAAELDVDTTSLTGTGPGGKFTAADVRRAHEEQQRQD